MFLQALVSYERDECHLFCVYVFLCSLLFLRIASTTENVMFFLFLPQDVCLPESRRIDNCTGACHYVRQFRLL